MTESKEYKEGFNHYQSSDMAKIWENGFKAAQDKFWGYQND